jgi:lipid-A-disaccharide synthase
VSAGEASGDAHAAALALALRAARPDVRLRGIGGPRMAAAGVELVAGIANLEAMGLLEAARTIPAHVALLRTIAAELRAEPYGLAVLVDYPGFHRRVASLAHRLGVPVLQYVAPQLWAWGPWRLGGYRRVVTHTAAILPFEQQFFDAHNVPATFVGHPLLDAARPERHEARRALGVADDAPVLGLFPGSRSSERAALWGVLRDAGRRMREGLPRLRVYVAADGPADFPGLAAIGARTAPAADVAAAADVAIAKSGTTTLQLALAGTPHVLVYRMHPFTWAVARRLVRVRRVGLVNLVFDRAVVPEYLQDAVTAPALAAAAGHLLEPGSPAAQAQRTAFAELPARLGPAGASGRVAQLALSMAA